MAIWQFNCLIVPRNTFAEKFRILPNEVDLEEFSSVNWWARTNISRAIIHDIVPLPRMNRAKIIQGVETWGEENGNRIDVVYSKKELVEEISVRLDIRNISEQFILELITFSNKLDCLIICEDGLVIDSHKNSGIVLTSILNQINESNAKKFVESPEDFFKNFKGEEEK